MHMCSKNIEILGIKNCAKLEHTCIYIFCSEFLEDIYGIYTQHVQCIYMYSTHTCVCCICTVYYNTITRNYSIPYDKAYHINDHFSESLSLVCFKMLQKVTIRILQYMRWKEKKKTWNFSKISFKPRGQTIPSAPLRHTYVTHAKGKKLIPRGNQPKCLVQQACPTKQKAGATKA